MCEKQDSLILQKNKKIKRRKKDSVVVWTQYSKQLEITDYTAQLENKLSKKLLCLKWQKLKCIGLVWDQ